jgi:hypothetical protein
MTRSTSTAATGAFDSARSLRIDGNRFSFLFWSRGSVGQSIATYPPRHCGQIIQDVILPSIDPRPAENTMLTKLRQMQRRLNNLDYLCRLGRMFCETVLLEIDGDEFYLAFRDGRLETITEGPSRKTPWRFAFRTDAEALSRFWQPIPPPGFHDIFGLVKIGRGRIDGDILSLVKNLRYFKEFLALGRDAVAS